MDQSSKRMYDKNMYSNPRDPLISINHALGIWFCLKSSIHIAQAVPVIRELGHPTFCQLFNNTEFTQKLTKRGAILTELGND
jgi:hypothetical protein